jgi:hypothetical protein
VKVDVDEQQSRFHSRDIEGEHPAGLRP